MWQAFLFAFPPPPFLLHRHRGEVSLLDRYEYDPSLGDMGVGHADELFILFPTPDRSIRRVSMQLPIFFFFFTIRFCWQASDEGGRADDEEAGVPVDRVRRLRRVQGVGRLGRVGAGEPGGQQVI